MAHLKGAHLCIEQTVYRGNNVPRQHALDKDYAANSLIERGIGSAYTHVKAVSENLDSLLQIAMRLPQLDRTFEMKYEDGILYSRMVRDGEDAPWDVVADIGIVNDSYQAALRVQAEADNTIDHINSQAAATQAAWAATESLRDSVASIEASLLQLQDTATDNYASWLAAITAVKNAAEAASVSASSAKTAAENAQSAAVAARDLAQGHATAASSAASTAAGHAGSAQDASIAAQGAASAASLSANAAASDATTASTAATTATGAASTATGAANTATNAATAANSSASAVAAQASAVAIIANTASTAAATATGAATTATNAATAAQGSANSAANSANAAIIAGREFGVLVAREEGVVTSGYPATRSVRSDMTMRRFFAEAIGGDATVAVRVNDVMVHGLVAVDAGQRITQSIEIDLNEGDAVTFDVEAGGATRLWAQIDGGAA